MWKPYIGEPAVGFAFGCHHNPTTPFDLMWDMEVWAGDLRLVWASSSRVAHSRSPVQAGQPVLDTLALDLLVLFQVS